MYKSYTSQNKYLLKCFKDVKKSYRGKQAKPFNKIQNKCFQDVKKSYTSQNKYLQKIFQRCKKILHLHEKKIQGWGALHSSNSEHCEGWSCGWVHFDTILNQMDFKRIYQTHASCFNAVSSDVKMSSINQQWMVEEGHK